MMLHYGKKGVLTVFTTLILLLTAFAVQAETVKTKYFSIDVPAGWQALEVLNENDDYPVFGYMRESGESTVVLFVGPATQSAKELAAESFAKMKLEGITASEPVEKDGVWEIASFDPDIGKVHVWIGANGKKSAMTTIAGNIEVGKAFLKGLKPVDPKIFPKF